MLLFSCACVALCLLHSALHLPFHQAFPPDLVSEVKFPAAIWPCCDLTWWVIKHHAAVCSLPPPLSTSHCSAYSPYPHSLAIQVSPTDSVAFWTFRLFKLPCLSAVSLILPLASSVIVLLFIVSYLSVSNISCTVLLCAQQTSLEAACFWHTV